MARALIGYSGFVGGNLRTQTSFDDVYRSTTIHEIRGKRYEIIVAAGIPAVKWKANQEPVHDRACIHRLLDHLRTVYADRFVFISTVDVYANPRDVDEYTPVTTAGLHPYGTHRHEAEVFIQQHFAQHCIVRLPGLFGPGLKKNMIFDLLTHGSQAHTHRESVFQFYDLTRLWADIEIILAHRLPLVNLVTEPLTTTTIARDVFGVEFTNITAAPPVTYDVHTAHAALFGNNGHYIASATDTLHRIRTFVTRERTPIPSPS